MKNTLNYDELDPGIRKLVKWFNDHKFTTMDSGDGVSKPKDYEEVLDYPHVAISASGHELEGFADDLFDVLCKEFGAEKLGTLGVRIDASYSPIDGVSLVLVSGLNDEKLGL